MKIEGELEDARFTGNGRFRISVTTDYDKYHSGSDANRALLDMPGRKVTIIIHPVGEKDCP